MRVALLTGCVQSVLSPQVHEATIRLLNRAGAEVVTLSGCCGAIVHHLGRETEGLAHAAVIIDRVLRERAAGGLDAVVVNASGCGTHLKDYGHIFRTDTARAQDAATVGALARDFTQVLGELGLPPATARGVTVAYHSACSLQHGQRLDRLPRELLQGAGYVLRPFAEAHLCCGSAGTYNLLQPELATQLRDRKLENLHRSGAQIVAAGNIGCIVQLASAAHLPVLHTAELLDWATGGPRPAGLEVVATAAQLDARSG